MQCPSLMVARARKQCAGMQLAPFFGNLLTIGLQAEVRVFAGGPNLCYIIVLYEFPLRARSMW